MEKPWRVISNADGVDNSFATLDEALKEADEIVELWRDEARSNGEWDEDVESVEVHLVTHAARITMREGDNEDDGVDYGMTEMLGNELDTELATFRAANARMKEALEGLVDEDCSCPCCKSIADIARAALKEEV